MLDFEVPCDCRLEWVGEFIANNSQIISPGLLGTCSNVNSYEGTPVFLLRTDKNGPCKHPEMSALSPVNSSSITLSWEWEAVTDADKSFETSVPSGLLDSENIQESIRACESFIFDASETSNSDGSDQSYLGFRIQVEQISTQVASLQSSEVVLDFCFLPTTIEEVYFREIAELKPATRYDVKIAAFKLTLNEHLPGAYREQIETSYTFGPFGRSSSVNTMDAIPAAIRVVSPIRREARVIEVKWDPLPANETGGQLQGYIIKQDVPNRTHFLQPYELSHVFNDAETIEQGFASFSIAAKTSAGKGPPTPIQRVYTCPANSEDVSGDGSDSCEAVPGFFKNEYGEFLNCAELTIRFPALQNGCVEPRVTSATLPVAPTFWKSRRETSEISPCPVAEYCLQTSPSLNSSMDFLCTENRTGIFCHDCDEGLVPASRACVACTPQAEYDAFVAVVCTVVFFVILAIVLALRILVEGKFIGCSWRTENQARVPRRVSSREAEVGVKKRRRRLPRAVVSGSFFGAVSSVPKKLNKVKDETGLFTKTKIFIGYLQVFFSYQRTFQFQEAQLGDILSFVSSLDTKHLINQIQYRCALNFNFYGILLASTLTPLALFMLVGVIVIVTVAALRGDTKRILDPMAEIVLAVLFLCYPTVSETIFETFPCQEFNTSEGMVYKLQVDYRTDCAESPARAGWVAYASLMILVYPVGVAALYAFVALHLHTKKYAKFLIRPYEDSSRWFETYEVSST